MPGFSAAALGPNDTLWVMPDNGFGNQRNSADFLLRIYRLVPSWQTDEGGKGEVTIRGFVQLSDPAHHVPFPIVHSEGKRLLTGNDFDIESLQILPDGTFFIGDEFGPYLLHVDVNGALLAPPIPFPRGRSPQNPTLGSSIPTVQRSGGFEAMAQSRDSRYLYPVLEKALSGGESRGRLISEYDTRAKAYTSRRWTYQVDAKSNSVSDAQITADGTLLILERDDRDGSAALTKRIYRADFGAPGRLKKTLLADLLNIPNPDNLGPTSSAGTGDPFALLFRCVETLVVLQDDKVLIANDTNFPADAARRRGHPDAAELITLTVPGVQAR